MEATQKPLPGRTSIVITRNKNLKAEGCIIVNDLEEAIKLGKENRQEEVFILGGGEIYKQAMKIADKIYLTEVKETFEGDTYFPEINALDWQEIKREEFEPDEKNPHAHAFVELIRVRK